MMTEEKLELARVYGRDSYLDPVLDAAGSRRWVIRLGDRARALENAAYHSEGSRRQYWSLLQRCSYNTKKSR